MIVVWYLIILLCRLSSRFSSSFWWGMEAVPASQDLKPGQLLSVLTGHVDEGSSGLDGREAASCGNSELILLDSLRRLDTDFLTSLIQSHAAMVSWQCGTGESRETPDQLFVHLGGGARLTGCQKDKIKVC